MWSEESLSSQLSSWRALVTVSPWLPTDLWLTDTHARLNETTLNIVSLINNYHLVCTSNSKTNALFTVLPTLCFPCCIWLLQAILVAMVNNILSINHLNLAKLLCIYVSWNVYSVSLYVSVTIRALSMTQPVFLWKELTFPSLPFPLIYLALSPFPFLLCSSVSHSSCASLFFTL